MSEEKHETIDELLAEFRGYSAGMPPSYHVTMSWHDFRRMLDRFDAAHKRERESITPKPDPDWKDICAKCKDGDIEPKHCEYYGEPNGCNSPIYGEHPAAEKSSAVGDAAKLREAVKCLMDNLNIHLMMPSEQMTINRAELQAMVKDCSEALAAPPRNCDVGTEQEQACRFLKYCAKQDCEKACPFRDCKNSYECAFGWAQMPYESEASDGE